MESYDIQIAKWAALFEDSEKADKIIRRFVTPLAVSIEPVFQMLDDFFIGIENIRPSGNHITILENDLPDLVREGPSNRHPGGVGQHRTGDWSNDGDDLDADDYEGFYSSSDPREYD